MTILGGLDDGNQIAKLLASHLTIRVVFIGIECSPQRGSTFEIKSRSVEYVSEVFLESLFMLLGGELRKTLELGLFGWWCVFGLTHFDGCFPGLAFVLARLR